MTIDDRLREAKISYDELKPYVAASPSQTTVTFSYRPQDGDLDKFVKFNNALRIRCAIGSEFSMYRFFVREVGPFFSVHLFNDLARGDFHIDGSEHVLHWLSAKHLTNATTDEKLYHIPQTHRALGGLNKMFRWSRS